MDTRLEMFSDRKFDKEQFSEDCNIKGYKVLDLVTSKMYFRDDILGLIAVINQGTETPTLYKTNESLPDNFRGLMGLLLDPGFVSKCQVRSFKTTSDLKDFLNEFIKRLTDPQ